MNRKYSTIMTLEDHRAAARALKTVLVGVTQVECAAQRKQKVPGRMLTRFRRIQRAVEKIYVQMQDVQERTLRRTPDADACWLKPESPQVPACFPPKRVTVMTLAEHIAGARNLGQASRAVPRFLDLVSDRKHLPVRILDIGLQIERLIHQIRCEMDDVQYVTLPRPDGSVDCWLGHFNYFDGDEDGATAGSQFAVEEQR